MVLFILADPKRNITSPSVTVLPPSPKECQNQKKVSKTIVCVATGFYPDHVTVSWEVDGQSILSGVATDTAALLHGGYYKMSSRLRVSAKDWFTPGKNFNCTVGFYDGKQTIYVHGSVTGVKGTGVLN